MGWYVRPTYLSPTPRGPKVDVDAMDTYIFLFFCPSIIFPDTLHDDKTWLTWITKGNVCVWWGTPRNHWNHETNMAPHKVFDRLRFGSLTSNDDLSSRRFVKSWYNVGFILIWLTWLKGQSKIFISVESCLFFFSLRFYCLFFCLRQF